MHRKANQKTAYNHELSLAILPPFNRKENHHGGNGNKDKSINPTSS